MNKYKIKFIYNKDNDINEVFIKTLNKELENKIYKESIKRINLLINY